jgi:hypothetical protein
MKSPQDLSALLARQWQNADLRDARVLGHADAWPVTLSIGRPPPRLIAADLDAVRDHLSRWRGERSGTVEWEPVSYRAVSDPVDLPQRWVFANCSEWIAACRDAGVAAEYNLLSEIMRETDPMFHSLLVRRRSLWRNRSVAEIVHACRSALALGPGYAQGKPLRASVLSGTDTKFIERNRALITALLDLRFDGEVSRLGLEFFLGAAADAEHWLLVADLDGELLTFGRQRVRASELSSRALPGERVLIVENEASWHQLPALRDTIAVLGAGLDLAWAGSQWLQRKRVGYWGDIDTWGLVCLARARQAIPDLQPLLMTEAVFDSHRKLAVQETVPAAPEPPSSLSADEVRLYRRLTDERLGRLEQELLPEAIVHQTVRAWADADPQVGE